MQLAGGGKPLVAEPQAPGAATAGPAAMEEEEDKRKANLRKDWKLAAARAAHLRATPGLLREEGFEDKLAQADAAAKAAEDLYNATFGGRPRSGRTTTTGASTSMSCSVSRSRWPGATTSWFARRLRAQRSWGGGYSS